MNGTGFKVKIMVDNVPNNPANAHSHRRRPDLGILRGGGSAGVAGEEEIK